jgi:hypothetical protein
MDSSRSLQPHLAVQGAAWFTSGAGGGAQAQPTKVLARTCVTEL